MAPIDQVVIFRQVKPALECHNWSISSTVQYSYVLPREFPEKARLKSDSLAEAAGHITST